MAYKLADENVARFQNSVLSILVEQGGKDSLSHLLQEMRYAGWKKLGSISDFELMLSDTGFTLDRRTYGDQPYVRNSWTTHNGHKTIHTVVKTFVTV